jgi:hypothetical protein
MYCSRSCIFVDGSEKVKHPSSKQITNPTIVVTTVNLGTGEVVYKRESGEEIGRATYDKLKSGSWYYCIIMGGGSPAAEVEFISEEPKQMGEKVPVSATFVDNVGTETRNVVPVKIGDVFVVGVKSDWHKMASMDA